MHRIKVKLRTRRLIVAVHNRLESPDFIITYLLLATRFWYPPHQIATGLMHFREEAENNRSTQTQHKGESISVIGTN